MSGLQASSVELLLMRARVAAAARFGRGCGRKAKFTVGLNDYELRRLGELEPESLSMAVRTGMAALLDVHDRPELMCALKLRQSAEQGLDDDELDREVRSGRFMERISPASAAGRRNVTVDPEALARGRMIYGDGHMFVRTVVMLVDDYLADAAIARRAREKRANEAESRAETA